MSLPPEVRCMIYGYLDVSSLRQILRVSMVERELVRLVFVKMTTLNNIWIRLYGHDRNSSRPVLVSKRSEFDIKGNKSDVRNFKNIKIVFREQIRRLGIPVIILIPMEGDEGSILAIHFFTAKGKYLYSDEIKRIYKCLDLNFEQLPFKHGVKEAFFRKIRKSISHNNYLVYTMI